MSCLWCGKQYEEHSDYASLSGVVPRMPCLGLKSGYFEKRSEEDAGKTTKPVSGK